MSFQDRAAKIAERCTFKRFQVGAVLVNGDTILSEGWAHVSQVRLATTASMHAEIHALARARHLALEGSVCYVATISRKSGNRTNSQPCATCAAALRAAGVRLAVYTVDNERVGILDLEAPFKGLKLYLPDGRDNVWA